MEFENNERINIPSSMIEFNVGGNTIWVQSPDGATTMRIKCTGTIKVDQCTNSPVSHVDLMLDGDINFCLSKDASQN